MTQYPLFKVHIDTDSALDELRTVFDSGFVNEGIQVTEFATAVAARLGAENLVPLNSCTSALTLAMRLCGVGPGTEVVTTPMTCIASNTPIVNLGGRVVWADIKPMTAMIDPEDVARKITDKTRAVICVDWAGTPCEFDRLAEVCRDAAVPLIQDAAHAFGATYNERPICEFADYTCFSFQAIKHLSCGDGGALVVRDAERFAMAKKLKWFGYDRDATKDEKGNWKGQAWSADVLEDEVGYKYNMNNVSAAIGLSQLPHIDRILDRHRANAKCYDELFDGSNSIEPLHRPDVCESSSWVYTAILKDENVNRDDVLARLNDEGIAAGLVHIPNNLYSCFQDSDVDLPGVTYFGDRQISLPCGWWLDRPDIEHIAARVSAAIV